MKQSDACITAALMAWNVTGGFALAGVDPRLKTFATEKRQQMDELATKLHTDVPPEARDFFRAAEAGDWVAVSNSFERIRSTTKPMEARATLPGLTNALFVPIHETLGAYEEFNRWDGSILQKFADGILHSMPAGSIYFGGTGPGRFIVTTIQNVARSPDIFIITQNGLGFTSYYTDYLRLTYGSRLWIPAETDVQQSLQRASGHTNDINFWMNVVGESTRSIFDHNKDKHEFYVEESYTIPWMYPYLEPHGLIFKLNRDPLTQLDPAVVARDREFWDKTVKELLADAHFRGNEPARQTYGKLRSAIGGAYANRIMTNEAEAAFKQAMELGPTCPEPAYRLAQMYTQADRFNDAVVVLDQFRSHLGATNSLREFTSAYITEINKEKRQAEEKQRQSNPPGNPQ
jgi:Tetratricopeptide repeat